MAYDLSKNFLIFIKVFVIPVPTWNTESIRHRYSSTHQQVKQRLQKLRNTMQLYLISCELKLLHNYFLDRTTKFRRSPKTTTSPTPSPTIPVRNHKISHDLKFLSWRFQNLLGMFKMQENCLNQAKSITSCDRCTYKWLHYCFILRDREFRTSTKPTLNICMWYNSIGIYSPQYKKLFPY